jgi:hypothetical protein
MNGQGFINKFAMQTSQSLKLIVVYQPVGEVDVENQLFPGLFDFQIHDPSGRTYTGVTMRVKYANDIYIVDNYLKWFCLNTVINNNITLDKWGALGLLCCKIFGR